jgi:imidazolonepropionase-like amidohydrolase
MAKHGTFLVPTSSNTYGSYESASAARRAAMEPNMQFLRAEISNAKAAGVRIACGFDAASEAKQGKSALELYALVKLGLSPIEAIRAATLTGADLMGWSDAVGSIEKGKFADLIAVDGDPLTDITVLQHVVTVIKDGIQVRRRASE